MTVQSLTSVLRHNPADSAMLHRDEQESRLNSFTEALLAEKPEKAPGAAEADSSRQADVPVDDESDDELRDTFQRFVGQTFFGQMLSTLRKSVGKPAYFHGGRGEEIFQSQMDQLLVEQMSEASAEQFAKPMYELFSLNRR